MRETGTYQTLADLRYFIPHPLPPAQPPLALQGEVISLYGEASMALGQLNEMCLKIPNLQRFIKAYVIKEALLSSAIEGIHTTLIEVFTQPIEGAGKPSKDTQLVLNYSKALEIAYQMIVHENFPLVSRVILKAHEVLMSDGVGESSSPGQFRKQSVRVGELVPPPALEIPKLMSELEHFMNEPSELPSLIKAGLAHVQFETIHPFLDGNGRIGRLLIVLMLSHDGLLKSPILYPSYYFKKYHSEYYQALDRVRSHGDFEGWIIYYLKAIRDSAQDAYIRTKEIEALEIHLQNMINSHKRFLKMKNTAIEVLNFLFGQPITTISPMCKEINKSYNAIQNILNEFVTLGFITERIINKRNKVYYFTSYLSILEKEF